MGHQQAVTRVERGERKVSLLEGVTLARLYGVSLDHLAGMTEQSIQRPQLSYEAGMRVAISTLKEALEAMGETRHED
jgi:hypothetical protein